MRSSTAVLLTMLFLGVGPCLAACGPRSEGFPWPLRSRAQSVSRLGVAALPGAPERVLARRVSPPTRANLDWAVSQGSPILRSRGEELPPEELLGARVNPRLFGGVVETGSLAGSLADTPLTPEERRQGLSLPLLSDYLSRWNAAEVSRLDEARTAIREERWGLRGRPGVPFQEAAELFLHQAGRDNAPELWVRIEFAPWARLFRDMPDQDGDGQPQVYGRLRPGLLSARALQQMRHDYLSRRLDSAQVWAWANNVVSLWYPSYNTDLVELGAARRWPLATTEPEVRAELGRFHVQEPTLVLRGKPGGRALYVVIQVPGMGPARAAPTSLPSALGQLQERLKRFPVTSEASALAGALGQELAAHGSLRDWLAKVAPQHRAIRDLLRQRPPAARGLIGRGGFLFYRKSLEYVVAADLRKQPAGKNPFPAIVAFQQYLRRLGVDFLLVPVPTKLEVFPDKLLSGISPGRLPLLAPAGRHLLLELARVGVESVDLLPALLAARRQAKSVGEEELYQPQDTHWTDRGLRLCARLIAKRIARYPWYSLLRAERVAFRLRRTSFTRFGDLHSRLLAGEQRRYKAATLLAHQVLWPDGKLYEDDVESPVVVLGDSFAGVYQRTDCQHAGVSAHLAHALGRPVDLVMSYGGGPNVRRTLLTRGEADLRRRRLVVWIFAARDLFDHWEDWEMIEGEKESRTGSGS